MKRLAIILSALFVLSVAFSSAVMGQSQASNPASNKAFFGSSIDQITLAPVDGATSGTVTLFDVTEAMKTSNNGALSATLSMEAALWTYNLTEAIVNGGRSASSSRAAIKAWIEVDGVQMEPGEVVFADRLQATGLEVNLACDTSTVDETCTVTGDVTLELFQRTKNANSFTFFIGPLPAQTHSVVVKAAAFIECTDTDGGVIDCPTGTLAGYDDASTQAAIGKATLLVEEQQNWGSN